LKDDLRKLQTVLARFPVGIFGLSLVPDIARERDLLKVGKVAAFVTEDLLNRDFSVAFPFLELRKPGFCLPSSIVALICRVSRAFAFSGSISLFAVELHQIHGLVLEITAQDVEVVAVVERAHVGQGIAQSPGQGNGGLKGVPALGRRSGFGAPTGRFSPVRDARQLPSASALGTRMGQAQVP
jgi:hypothetical protein